MLIGFIVIIIMILVIVGIMALGTGGAGDVGTYSAQIKKLKVFISNIESEAVMYHGMNNSYAGFNAKYLSSVNIGGELFFDNPADVDLAMTKTNWENLPDDFNCDGTNEADTVNFLGGNFGGVYLLKGYVPGNQKGILVYSCQDVTGTDYAQIRFIKQKTGTSYSIKFDEMFEAELSDKETFYGS